MSIVNDPYVDYMIKGIVWPFSYEDLEAEHKCCRQVDKILNSVDKQYLYLVLQISDTVRKIMQFKYTVEYMAFNEDAKNDVDWSIDFATNLMAVIADINGPTLSKYQTFLNTLNMVWEGMALSIAN